MQTEQTSIGRLNDIATRLQDNVERVIVGKTPVIESVLVAIFSQGHILIEDVPGIGKTTLARSIAQSLGCSFKRIQFTPDLIPADLVGINFYNQRSGEFEFRPGPINTQILLADEVNRATPRTQSALLEAMEERQVTIEGQTLELPQPFLVLATENPVELEGTFPLPEAQLDRFMLRIKLGYPDEAAEEEILDRHGSATRSTVALDPVVSSGELLAAADDVDSVHFEPVLRRYMLEIVRATRRHSAFVLGASPRASLALFRAARTLAALRGRSFVLPDDIQEMALLVLPHRLILSSQARLRGRDSDALVEEVLESVPVPITE
ncbi:MAG TPA: MoxR family ATPase [Dehalococcoidia bacterium]|nr:MoxR family ATPase [Dehalococcoidia bacterium]